MIENGGVFYVIQLLPEQLPNRVKLGYSATPERRLRSHRTVAPHAQIVAAHACPAWAEPRIIRQVATLSGVSQVGCEVFDVDDLPSFLALTEQSFREWSREDFSSFAREAGAAETESPFMLAFGRYLREARAVAGLSQRGLAIMADVALDTVRLVEKGERVPGLDKAVLILRALGRPAWKALREVEESIFGDD